MSLVFIGDIHQNWHDVEAGHSALQTPPKAAVLLGDIECEQPLDAVAAGAASGIPLLIGTTILFLGFILPPGSRTFHGERTPTVLWLRIGGPCWCLAR